MFFIFRLILRGLGTQRDLFATRHENLTRMYCSLT